MEGNFKPTTYFFFVKKRVPDKVIRSSAYLELSLVFLFYFAVIERKKILIIQLTQYNDDLGDVLQRHSLLTINYGFLTEWKIFSMKRG